MKEKIIMSMLSVFAIVLLIAGTFVGTIAEDVTAQSSVTIQQISSDEGRFVLPEDDIAIIDGHTSLEILAIFYEEDEDDNGVNIRLTPHDGISDMAGREIFLEEGDSVDDPRFSLSVARVGQTSVSFEIIGKSGTLPYLVEYDFGEKFALKPDGKVAIGEKLTVELNQITHLAVDTEIVGYDSIVASITLQLYNTGTDIVNKRAPAPQTIRINEGETFDFYGYEVKFVKADGQVGYFIVDNEDDEAPGTPVMVPARVGSLTYLDKGQTANYASQKVKVTLNEIIVGCSVGAQSGMNECFETASFTVTQQQGSDETGSMSSTSVRLNDRESVMVFGYKLYAAYISESGATIVLYNEDDETITDIPVELDEKVKLSKDVSAVYLLAGLKVSYNEYIYGTCVSPANEGVMVQGYDEASSDRNAETSVSDGASPIVKTAAYEPGKKCSPDYGVFTITGENRDVSANNPQDRNIRTVKVRVELGQSLNLGNYRIHLIDASDDWAYFYITKKDNRVDPIPGKEFDYVCPAGCKEVEEGCLCPKIKVWRTMQGYSVQGSEGTTSVKSITVTPGDRAIRATSENDVNIEIGASNLEEGFDLPVTIEGKEKNIKVSTSEDLWTYIEDEGQVKARTRNTVVSSEEGFAVETDKGKNYVKVLPSEAITKTEEFFGDSEVTVEIVETDDGAAYSIDADREMKILGIISSKGKYRAEVDVESGEVSDYSKPWYSFISTK